MIPILQEARWRTLAPGQVCRILVVDPVTGTTRVVHESHDVAYESPNWTPDGLSLIVNAAGRLYSVPAAGGVPTPIASGALDDHNNDHLVSRDGTTIYSSSETTGHLFAVPVGGGEPVRVSPDREGVFGYFLQGQSPDGGILAFTGAERRDGLDFVSGLFLLDLGTREVSRLSGWTADSVGCDWSPDGWLYFGSELGSSTRGHSQVHRMRPDGRGVKQLTDDERVNWFPKVSPDGSRVVYLSFPPGTVGHATDVDVVIRSMEPDGSGQRDVLHLTGGQGTLNMNSWAPSSDSFACVSYELEY
ncbi:PD40 domain-containing protein [Frondihabitans sp. VKM Ac-2883]|uniref:TolB family protein n=1 Tax=Frondihabitans sp. VKM Ac-2883 TaxID=2783823 RepID=UPI00188D50E7|nr:PD40 domain-containing protein [Frondihabitans sp. VKM Ac-2883]MBF4577261.1 PD40 domain-containing protein [Frondihabitans sp. VKM Ac-2883]